MTVKELMDSGIISKYANIQFWDLKEDTYETAVDYLEDSGFWEQIESLMDYKVLVLRANATKDDKTPYILIGIYED